MQVSQVVNTNLSLPTFSIIIEWENFVQSEARHASIMLQNLIMQIKKISKKISTKPELIIVYNSKAVESPSVEQFVMDNLASSLKLVELKMVPSSGMHYYELKNFGASQSSRDLNIFLDSDVIPEDGWLEGLIEPFQNQEISVVAGCTYMPLDSIMGKALSLVWFYPRTFNIKQFFEKNHFYANNVAFRHKIFKANPFPRLSQFHGQCEVVSDKLHKSGIKIFYQKKSKLCHDVPDSVRDFVTWSLTQGLDFVASRRLRRVTWKSGSKQYKHKRSSLKQILLRSRQRFTYAGISPKDTVGVSLILLSYFGIMSFGILISALQPNYYSFIRKKNWRMWT